MCVLLLSDQRLALDRWESGRKEWKAVILVCPMICERSVSPDSVREIGRAHV